MLADISSMDKVSIVALAQVIQKEHGRQGIADLATQLGIPLMSEWRNRQALISRLSASVVDKVPEPGPGILKWALFLISGLMERVGAIQENRIRRSYAGWFKRLLVDCHERGATYAEIEELTGVEIETQKGFRDVAPAILAATEMDEKTRSILGTWQSASPWHQQTLDHFLLYYLKQHSEISIGRDEMRATLIRLGLHTPRGPKIKDQGAQVKRPFAPHALWEGDGKMIKICVNGVTTKFTWYAFIDQNTTLLVGSTIDGTETAEALLEALRDGKRRTSLAPIGILIDNRVPESDLRAVWQFCREHGIVIVRTFPGNPKTNGIIEGNFSIFERFVGDINITGNTPDEIALSIANTVIEIFTQLRGHSPRPALGGRSPEAYCEGAMRPEWAREAIQRMAARFSREQANADGKWELIEPARSHFGKLEWESEQKIKRQLTHYPPLDIVAAQARYLAQIAKHPDNHYGAEYFMAILRYKREAKAKEVFTEAYVAGLKASTTLFALHSLPNEDTCAERAAAEIIAAADLPSPAQQRLQLDALAWWLIGYSARRPLPPLWKKIETLATRSISLSLRWWSVSVEHLGERLGEILFSNSAVSCRNIQAVCE